MMGRRRGDQTSLFCQFRLDERVSKDHLLRRVDGFVTVAVTDMRERLRPYYSDIGRPSVDPELMIRMLIIGYCYALRSERRLTQEVELHLAYRWFCRLDLDDRVPHHSTFSENRLHRFRESDVFRHIFERVVFACMAGGLVKGEGFAVDASVMEANASRYHGKAPEEIVWAEPERQTRAVREYLSALEAEDPDDLFDRAHTAEQIGDIAEAERLYRLLMKSDPTDASAPFNLGNMLRASSRIVEAEAALRAATRANPAFAEAWYNLADLLDDQGRSEVAVECLRKALVVAPGYIDAMFNLALMLQQKGAYPEAADYWRQYLTSDHASEWAARARRSLKFCEIQVNSLTCCVSSHADSDQAA